MGSGVATVGRRPYAVGLYWENSPSGRVSQAAKEAARQPGQQAEFYAVRAGDKGGRVPQFGLSPAGANHKNGMPAFAACLANQQPGSWAGAFRLREGTVITVVRDDLVVPDGDQFFVDEGEARDRLLQEIGFGGLQRIYAPEAWGVPGADTMPVSLLLNDYAGVKLQPIEIPKRLIIGGVAAAVILALVIGIGWYIQEKNAEEAAAEAQRLAALEKARQAANNLVPGALMPQKIEYPPPERFWEEKPLPMTVIAACHQGLNQVPAAIAGWHLTQLKCNGTTISTEWQRLTNAFTVTPPAFVISETGASASMNINLPTLTSRGTEELVDSAEVTQRYLHQDWPGTIARAAPDPKPLPPPGYKGEWNPPDPPWVKRSFTVTIPVLPWNLEGFFGDLPGTVINSLNYSPGGAWTVDGVIYEKRS